ncbi:arginine--tRNA ligase [Candidatus Babeliales bacterium]|nr:arginine--tRNA ligase [Candidatus Babeliales bacterium]
MNSIEAIAHLLTTVVKKLYSPSDTTLSQITCSLNLEESKQAFGDLSSNAALVVAKELKRNPREIAQEIVTKLNHALIKKLDIAGPGFLNITLTDQALTQLASDLYAAGASFFKPSGLTPQKYSIEFVSANPTGPLHLGHGRGGIIGDVLGNVLRFLGHKVTKEYYINDAGSQMNKLGASFKIRCQQELGELVSLPEDGYRGEYLVELARTCVKEYGKSLLAQPDAFFIEYAHTHLLKRIEATLKKYGITFDMWFSEKTLHENGTIDRELEQLAHDKHTYEKDGAVWFKATEFGDDKDRVLKKSSGELTYAAADFAYMKDKFNRGFDHLIMILGQDHHSYVTRLKGMAEAMNYDPNRLDVILYQLVSLREGDQQLRMSKRAGHMVTLQDIIDTVGTDVARFFYLNRKPEAHLDFDLELALKKTDDNPVYYIQYAYVRTRSILEKAQQYAELLDITHDDCKHVTRAEAMLLKKIASLKQLLNVIGASYQIHLLSYYTIELAQTFHSYYAKYRVIEEDQITQSRGRLATIHILNKTFHQVLSLLGISQPASM